MRDEAEVMVVEKGGMSEDVDLMGVVGVDVCVCICNNIV